MIRFSEQIQTHANKCENSGNATNPTKTSWSVCCRAGNRYVDGVLGIPVLESLVIMSHVCLVSCYTFVNLAVIMFHA